MPATPATRMASLDAEDARHQSSGRRPIRSRIVRPQHRCAQPWGAPTPMRLGHSLRAHFQPYPPTESSDVPICTASVTHIGYCLHRQGDSCDRGRGQDVSRYQPLVGVGESLSAGDRHRDSELSDRRNPVRFRAAPPVCGGRGARWRGAPSAHYKGSARADPRALHIVRGRRSGRAARHGDETHVRSGPRSVECGRSARPGDRLPLRRHDAFRTYSYNRWQWH
jgi:hypothetical protein